MRYQENYNGRYTKIEDAESLKKLILGAEAPFQDLRPFVVVRRYLQQMGYVPAVTEHGGPALVYERNGSTRVRCITAAKLLYICRDMSREAQGQAENMFLCRCAEEDEEELELLIELCKAQNMAAHTTVPAAPHVQECKDEDDMAAQDIARQLDAVLVRDKKREYVSPLVLF